MVNLFVYGTLRTPDGGEPDDTRNFEFVADEIMSAQPATLRGAHILSFIHYPGIVPGEGTVLGELFELTAAGLEICDGIESHPDFFRRTETTVLITGGDEVRAWVYWAPGPMIESGTRIASGDWFDRDRSASDGRTIDQALAEDRARL